MYKIVASDLDGTLLTPEHTLSSYTIKTLRLLTSKGIHFIFATGRHYKDVSFIKKKIDISAFLITSNGARVHNNFNELIMEYNLDNQISLDLCKIKYLDPDIITQVYKDDGWYINKPCLQEDIFYKESNFYYKLFKLDCFVATNISKVFFTCHDLNKLINLKKEISLIWGNKINVAFSCPSCLEVISGNVSKGIALQFVAEYLGLTLESCIAFGDGMNDKDMLIMAGKGCIMLNADPRLKYDLPNIEVIDSNTNEGVSKYINKLYF
ncbi:Cof-type HAD-IIB family hydrolase [Buchnera aphidicola (Neophyllaphis podocarpi)]|uniref:Cof-type HAD-IIB family hydrolase n=1 Tax=Buchnera aphidicola TaxID=9 RepID=UPI0031B805F8